MGLWDDVKQAWDESTPQTSKPVKSGSEEIPPSTWLPPSASRATPPASPSTSSESSLGWKGWVGGIVGIIVVVSLIFGGGSEKKTAPAKPASEAPSSASSSSSGGSNAPALPRSGSYARAKYELRNKFKQDVVEIDRLGGVLTVELKADDSGIFPKTMMRQGAKDAFRQVFKDAAYTPREMIVQFHGPLVEKATGRESDGIWSVYAMRRSEAKQIVWSNQDQIDWDLFRTMIRGDV